MGEGREWSGIGWSGVKIVWYVFLTYCTYTLTDGDEEGKEGLRWKYEEKEREEKEYEEKERKEEEEYEKEREEEEEYENMKDGAFYLLEGRFLCSSSSRSTADISHPISNNGEERERERERERQRYDEDHCV